MGRTLGLAAALVAALAASAAAQDYVKTNATGLLESRPSGATQVAFADGNGPSPLQAVTLPFSFPYYAGSIDQVTVVPYGYVVPGSLATITNPAASSANHGQVDANGAFPYTQTGLGGAGQHNVDGLLCPFWNNFQVART